MLILNKDCYTEIKKIYIPPKLGHGALAPLVNRDRRPWLERTQGRTDNRRHASITSGGQTHKTGF